MNIILALIAVLLASAPFIYLAGRRLGPDWAFGGSLLALATASGMFVASLSQDIGNFAVQDVAFMQDGISQIMTGLVLVLGFAVMFYSRVYVQEDENQEKYAVLLLTMIGVIIGLVHAGDLFNLWLWFEAMAIASYMLVAFYHRQANALEATLKYLVQSAAGSILILAGIALVLLEQGTLSLVELSATNAASNEIMLIAGGLFIIGFGVKVALVPLHTWLPDAHSQAPSGISAMLSGVVIEGGLIALIRALSILAGDAVTWGTLLMTFAVLNIIVGNVLALRQTQLKRLLAYSSVAHMGYIVLGLGIGIYSGQAAGIEGGMFHLISHGLMKGLAFLAIGALMYTLHMAHAGQKPIELDDISGAARRYPMLALTLTIALLGLGGLPPMVGFMSKWQIFLSGMEAENLLITALILIAALNSILSLAYYAPIINRLYRREPAEAVQHGGKLPLAMAAPLAGLAILIIVIGFWPGLLDDVLQSASDALKLSFIR
ncbi:MAG: complex I subunit 5 family protein [Anaerolineales bacterium]